MGWSASPRALVLVVALLAPAVFAQETTQLRNYDVLAYQLNWQPGTCDPASGCNGAIGAFTFQGAVASNRRQANPLQAHNGTCPGPEFDVGLIPPDVQRGLACIYRPPAGARWDVASHEEGWLRLWDQHGKCTELGVAQFFSLITSTFQQYNPNTALAVVNVTLDARSPYWDSDEMLDVLDAAFGVELYSQCDDWMPDTSQNRLTYVDLCLDPNSLQPVDCKWSGSSGRNAGCAGPLRVQPGAPPPAACAQYFPVTIPGAVLGQAASAAGSSGGGGGSSTPAIVGGVLGGLAALAVCAAAFAWWRRRRARRQTLACGLPITGSGQPDIDSFLYPEGDGSKWGSAGSAGGKPGTDGGSSSGPLTPTPSGGQLIRAAGGSMQLGGNGSGGSGRQLGSAAAQWWNVPFEQLTLRHVIGVGSFGKVYLADWAGGGTQVAAKLLLADQGPAAQPSPALLKMGEEAELMLSLRHPNIVQLVGVCQDPPCLLTEYCGRGSLTSCLAAARDDPVASAEMTWVRRLRMALDAARGMCYLHARSVPVVHRDLKSPNLLVTNDWQVKVTDFNLSKFVEDGESQLSSATAMNPRWLAPEVMAGQRATTASDVFSFAVVLWELLTWELPFPTGNAWHLVGLVTRGGRLEVPPPDELPGPAPALGGAQLAAYLQLMRRCWAQAPGERPAFPEIIQALRQLLQEVEAEHGGASPQ